MSSGSRTESPWSAEMSRNSHSSQRSWKKHRIPRLWNILNSRFSINLKSLQLSMRFSGVNAVLRLKVQTSFSIANRTPLEQTPPKKSHANNCSKGPKLWVGWERPPKTKRPRKESLGIFETFCQWLWLLSGVWRFESWSTHRDSLWEVVL